MKDVTITGTDDHTQQACRAIPAAARTECDFAGWLASVLGKAAEVGSSDTLTAGRPGSWEAELVQQLTKGTAGSGDEYLADCREPLP
jgi:hypothetical protein